MGSPVRRWERPPILTGMSVGSLRPDRTDLTGFAIGLVLLGCLVAIDVLLGERRSIAGAFVLAPLLVALTGSVSATATLAVLALVAAAASGGWNETWGDPGHAARSAVVLVGGVIAVAAAIARRRALLEAQRLELLDRIGGIADGSLPLDRALERLTALIVPSLADICIIDAIGAEGTSRIAVRAGGMPDPGRVERRIRERAPSVPGYLRESGRGSRPDSHFVPRADDAVLRGIAHDEGEDLAFIRSLGVCSFVIVPLHVRGRTIATLTLITTRDSGRSLGRHDVRFAEVMSGRVALALDNAGLFSDLESVERRLDAVMNLVDEAVIVFDADARLVYANSAAARWLGCESVEGLLDDPAAALASTTLRDEAGGSLERAGDVLARACAPAERWAGVLRSERPSEGERWLDVRYQPIAGAGGEVLFGVTTVHDVTSIKQAEFTTRVLSETARLLDSARDFRLTLRGIAELAVPTFADLCAVYLPGEGGALDPVALAHSDPVREELLRRLQASDPVRVEDERATARAFRERRPVLLEIDDEYLARTADEERTRLLRLLDVRSVIVAPLLAGPRAVGTVTFANHGDSRRFGGDDVTLAVEIAARAGLAAENARLAGEEAEIAELLQLGLRPAALPAIAGWELASMYRSAGEVTQVGGDFYDAFRVEDGWLLAIGDVVGHGAAAASLTALARYTLRTAATLTNDPEQSLRRLHDAFAEHGKDELCSVALVLLAESDDDPAEVVVLSAGHPLPLHVSAAGGVREVGSTGPLLGVIDAPGWPVSRVRLAAGDQLILYTDGVPEAKGDRGRFGDERLRRRLAEADGPTAAISSVEAALDEFCPEGGDDDAALVAIQRLPSRLAFRPPRDRVVGAPQWSEGREPLGSRRPVEPR